MTSLKCTFIYLSNVQQYFGYLVSHGVLVDGILPL